ncbi:MAG: methyltransferase domain-containing protein [Planctomycetota bacterium]|nr:methyltransferase domain-containing protein [Planctomycetota bacterium]
MPATPFDQEQRYRLLGDLLRAQRGDGPPLRILDVGGRTGVLRRYLSEGDLVVMADTEASDEPGLVLATGSALPFADRQFDAVVAADTLEHVPGEFREAFCREACRVSKGLTVLAGPYYQPRVAEAELRLAEFVRTRLGTPHRYLEEHLELGLPDRAAVEQWFRDAGATDVRSVGHGNLERWLGLMTIALLLDHDPATRELAGHFHSFYNHALLPDDRAGEVYRHLVIANMAPEWPVDVNKALAPRDIDAASAEPILHALDHLRAFDHARDLFEKERARLEDEIARRDEDLREHKVSLEEARDVLVQSEEALATAREDLEGHRQSLEEAEQDLAGHRESLVYARDELSQHVEVLKDVREDLEGHRGALTETREALEAMSAKAVEIHEELLHKTRWRRKFWSIVKRRPME